MIKEENKKITFTLKNLEADMFEKISQETKLTKSEILHQLIKDYTITFWLDPTNKIEDWKNYVNQYKK